MGVTIHPTVRGEVFAKFKKSLCSTLVRSQQRCCCEKTRLSPRAQVSRHGTLQVLKCDHLPPTSISPGEGALVYHVYHHSFFVLSLGSSTWFSQTSCLLIHGLSFSPWREGWTISYPPQSFWERSPDSRKGGLSRVT